MYSRAAVTVGYFALLHEGDSGLFAAKLRMFVVSCSSPLLVIEPLVIVECRHGYVTVDVTQTQPLRALPWSVGLCVTHCAAVEHAPGTLSLMPADCLHLSSCSTRHTPAAAQLPPTTLLGLSPRRRPPHSRWQWQLVFIYNTNSLPLYIVHSR